MYLSINLAREQQMLAANFLQPSQSIHVARYQRGHSGNPLKFLHKVFKSYGSYESLRKKINIKYFVSFFISFS